MICTNGKRSRVPQCYLPVALAVCLQAATTRAEPQPVDWHKRCEQISAYMHRCESFGFSGALLVGVGDRVILGEGYGFADRERGIRNTPDTVFPVASITKPVTATAVLKLVELGRLHTSDRIGDLLDNVPADHADITVHELLTHTAGLMHDYDGDATESPANALAGALKQPLRDAPRETYAYSNMGYGILASIVERYAHMPYTDFVTANVFDPAGMTHSGYLGDTHRLSGKPLAITYNRSTAYGSAATRSLSWQSRGAGGLATTVGDLFAFWRAFKNGRIVNAKLVARALAPHARVRDHWTYGYGWHRFKTKYGDVIYHGGNATPNGVTAELRYYPDCDVTTVLLVNVMRDDTGYNRTVRDGFAAILFGQDTDMPPAHVDLPPKAMERFVGTYDIPNRGRLTIQRDHAGLSAAADGQGLIDFMSSQGGDAAKVVESLNAKTLALVRAGCSGNPSTIERDDWKELMADPRPCDDIKVVGTTLPAGKLEEATTFVRTRRSPERIVRCVWYDDECYLLDGPGPVELYRLQPTSPQALVGYDLFTGNQIELVVSEGEPHATSITLTAGGQSATGHRVD